MGIQVSIIFARVERAVFLCNEEERSSLRGLGWNDSPSSKMFFNEIFAHLLFFWVKRIYFSNLWDERWLQVNGMVI